MLGVVGVVFGKWPFLRIIHVLRILNMPAHFKEFADYCKESVNVVLSAATMAITNMALSTTIMLIWCSALWSIVHYDGTEFSRSMYFSVSTFARIGYGDISAETVFETQLSLRS